MIPGKKLTDNSKKSCKIRASCALSAAFIGESTVSEPSSASSSPPVKVGAALASIWQELGGLSTRRVDVDQFVDDLSKGNGKFGWLLSDDQKKQIIEATSAIDSNPWHLENRKRLLKAALLGRAMVKVVTAKCEAAGDSVDNFAGNPDRACKAMSQIDRLEAAPDSTLGAMILIPDSEYKEVEEKFDGDKHMIAAHFEVPVEAVLLWQKWADVPLEFEPLEGA